LGGKPKPVAVKMDLMEDIIIERNIMLRFIAFLDNLLSLENMNFWLECQVYKYLRKQEETDTMAQSIYDRYLGPNSLEINSDDDALLAELDEKIKAPTRTTFMLIQNAIWGLIKLDSFPKFKDAVNSNPDILKMKPKELKEISTKYATTIELLDRFLAFNKEHPIEGGFKPNILPDDFYEEHLHTVLPTIDEVWRDKDLFLAFREFLYQQFAHENLAFYLEAAHYETVPADQRGKRAQEIYDKFVGPDAPKPINLDGNLISSLSKQIPTPNENTFVKIKDRIYKVLVNEWFPDFIVSPLYHACNKETIVYLKSDGGRKRSDTLTHYELLFLGGASA